MFNKTLSKTFIVLGLAAVPQVGLSVNILFEDFETTGSARVGVLYTGPDNTSDLGLPPLKTITMASSVLSPVRVPCLLISPTARLWDLIITELRIPMD